MNTQTHVSTPDTTTSCIFTGVEFALRRGGCNVARLFPGWWINLGIRLGKDWSHSFSSSETFSHIMCYISDILKNRNSEKKGKTEWSIFSSMNRWVVQPPYPPTHTYYTEFAVSLASGKLG